MEVVRKISYFALVIRLGSLQVRAPVIKLGSLQVCAPVYANFCFRGQGGQ